MFTIGVLSERSGFPATTLRYYDRLGLVVPDRNAGGRRVYGDQVLGRLRLIRLLQLLGCSLEEIALVLGPSGDDERREIAQRKLAEAQARIAELTTVAAVLEHLARCRHLPTEGARCQQEIARLLAGAGR